MNIATPSASALTSASTLPNVTGPTAALFVRDRLRRHQLECVLDRAPDGEADVLVIDLAPGESLPPGPATAPRLVLTDDAGLAADATLEGVLPRDASARQIAAAVASLAEGLTVRAPVPAPVGFAPAPPLLTPRELEILGLIGQGMSNKVIARRLGISAHTVKYHLEAVFAKLNVRSRAEAATQGLRRGLVEL
jgi:DNA-binding CsgD family transcriptional regulator